MQQLPRRSRRPHALAAGTKDVAVTGTGFGTDVSALHVTVGGADCAASAVSDTTISCTLDGFTAGPHPVQVLIEGVGLLLAVGGGLGYFLLGAPLGVPLAKSPPNQSPDREQARLS